MRKGIGYVFLALAVAAALLGLSFALLAGGYEADAVRVAGIELLFLAAGIAVAGALILRSGRKALRHDRGAEGGFRQWPS